MTRPVYEGKVDSLCVFIVLPLVDLNCEFWYSPGWVEKHQNTELQRAPSLHAFFEIAVRPNDSPEILIDLRFPYFFSWVLARCCPELQHPPKIFVGVGLHNWQLISD